MGEQLNAHHKIVSTALEDAQLSSSLGRDWDGVEVDWLDWKSGGNASAPAQQADAIVMRVSGRVRLTQTRDGRTHSSIAVPGNVTLHPRGIESKWSWTGPGSIAVARLPPALLSAAAGMTLKAPPPELTLANCFGGHDVFVERILNLFIDELRAPPHPAQRYITQALSSALACHMVQRFATQGVAARPQAIELHAHAVRRVQEYVREHLHEHVSLDTLASVANVSRFHFARLFRAAAGISAMQFLEQTRMERAQELIRHSRLPLAQVALLVGYEDPSYFSRRFRLFVGATPAAYARAARN